MCLVSLRQSDIYLACGWIPESEKKDDDNGARTSNTNPCELFFSRLHPERDRASIRKGTWYKTSRRKVLILWKQKRKTMRSEAKQSKAKEVKNNLCFNNKLLQSKFNSGSVGVWCTMEVHKMCMQWRSMHCLSVMSEMEHTASWRMIWFFLCPNGMVNLFSVFNRHNYYRFGSVCL